MYILTSKYNQNTRIYSIFWNLVKNPERLWLIIFKVSSYTWIKLLKSIIFENNIPFWTSVRIFHGKKIIVKTKFVILFIFHLLSSENYSGLETNKLKKSEFWIEKYLLLVTLPQKSKFILILHEKQS